MFIEEFRLTLAQTMMYFGYFGRYLSEGKSIDKSFMYYSNKTFSGLLQGAGGSHVENIVSLYYTYVTQ